MTVAERKEALLNWIRNLEDEAVLAQLEALRAATAGEALPPLLQQLLAERSRQDPDTPLNPDRPLKGLFGN